MSSKIFLKFVTITNYNQGDPVNSLYHVILTGRFRCLCAFKKELDNRAMIYNFIIRQHGPFTQLVELRN